MMSTMTIPFTTRVLVLRFTGPPSPLQEFGCCSDRLSAPSKIIHHPSASLRAGSDTETRSLGVYGVLSVISVPPWLIFIPMGRPQTHVTLRIDRQPILHRKRIPGNSDQTVLSKKKSGPQAAPPFQLPLSRKLEHGHYQEDRFRSRQSNPDSSPEAGAATVASH